MKLVRKPARASSDDHLIPLINVIFLMLIFFMVIGHIGSAEPLEVAPPVSAQGRPVEEQPHVLFLSADGRIALGETIIPREALAEQVATWLAETRAPNAPQPATLTLKADAAVRAGELSETLDRLRAAGVTTVALITAAGR